MNNLAAVFSLLLRGACAAVDHSAVTNLELSTEFRKSATDALSGLAWIDAHSRMIDRAKIYERTIYREDFDKLRQAEDTADRAIRLAAIDARTPGDKRALAALQEHQRLLNLWVKQVSEWVFDTGPEPENEIGKRLDMSAKNLEAMLSSGVVTHRR